MTTNTGYFYCPTCHGPTHHVDFGDHWVCAQHVEPTPHWTTQSDHPTCWCGEPAEYVQPAEPDLFVTNAVMLNSQPGYTVCWQHANSDWAQPLGTPLPKHQPKEM